MSRLKLSHLGWAAAAAGAATVAFISAGGSTPLTPAATQLDATPGTVPNVVRPTTPTFVTPTAPPRPVIVRPTIPTRVTTPGSPTTVNPDKARQDAEKDAAKKRAEAEKNRQQAEQDAAKKRAEAEKQRQQAEQDAAKKRAEAEKQRSDAEKMRNSTTTTPTTAKP